jgi:hypothetical protein
MKLVYRQIAGAVAATVGLAACVQSPTLATIPVSPGPNKSFEAFTADQAACQQYASGQVAPAVNAANNQAVGTALITTALGAGLGAAVGGGGWHGNAGRGAGIGAASGAAVGTIAGAGQSSYAQLGIQQQYDIMYGQCMAAHGNSVPSFAPPPGTPPYAGGPSGYSGGPSPYSGGPPRYSGGPSPYSGGPPPYSGGPPPYSGGPSPYSGGQPPYSGGPSPYYGGPPPSGTPYPAAPPGY